MRSIFTSMRPKVGGEKYEHGSVACRRVRVKNQINLLSFLPACLRTRQHAHETPHSAPHPHRCSYLPCWCVWCCWPPSESPGVFYASPADRTPCVAADCDGEDLRKSRFAVLLRRPSFFKLACGCSGCVCALNPLTFLFFFSLRSLNSAGESVEEGESGLGNQKLRLFFLRTGGRLAARFSVVHRAYRDAAQGTQKRGENAGAADDRLGAMGEGGGEEINRSDFFFKKKQPVPMRCGARVKRSVNLPSTF